MIFLSGITRESKKIFSECAPTAQYISSEDAVYKVFEKQKIDLLMLTISEDDFTDKISVVEYIHDCYFSTRIFAIVEPMITTKAISLLSAGVDEYISVHAHRTEIKMRIQRLLHLTKHPEELSYSLPECQFIPDTGTLTVQNKKIQMRKKESQLLHCLFQHKNQLVKRETLVSFAWNDADALPTRTTLDVYIRKIRMRLGIASDCLSTVRGFGYILRERNETTSAVRSQ